MKKKEYKISILLIYYLFFMIIMSTSYIFNKVFTLISNENINKVAQYQSIFFYITHIILLIICCLTFKTELKFKLKAFYNQLGKNLKRIFIGFIIILISNILVGLFIVQQGSNQESLSILQKQSSGFILLLFYLITIIIGPINEEFIFRRILIGEGKKYIKPIFSIIISSIFFGIIHIHSLHELTLALPYVVVGLILGTIYYKSNNIITSIILHIINNFFGILILFFS